MLDQAARDFNRTLGSRIREERERKGMSQTELGKKLGLKRMSISHLENGERQLPVHLLGALTRALGIPVRDLIPGILDESKPVPQASTVDSSIVAPEYEEDLEKVRQQVAPSREKAKR